MMFIFLFNVVSINKYFSVLNNKVEPNFEPLEKLTPMSSFGYILSTPSIQYKSQSFNLQHNCKFITGSLSSTAIKNLGILAGKIASLAVKFFNLTIDSATVSPPPTSTSTSNPGVIIYDTDDSHDPN